jgi:FtsP/CotA-like multicopper oxidase with cupredoxin domain
VNTYVNRRVLLRAGAGTGAALLLDTGATACTDDSAPAAVPDVLIEPSDPSVAAAESAHYHSGAIRTITLDPVASQIDLGGVIVSTWTYGGRLPGAEIRVTRGDVITTHVANRLSAETTVHWHGIAIRNDMDGVRRSPRTRSPRARPTPTASTPPAPAPTGCTRTSASNGTAACTPRGS